MRFSSAFIALSAPFLFASAAPAYRRANPTDLLVLKFAHVLEQLETQFYNDALKKFKAPDFLAAGFSTAEVPIEQFKQIVTHEQAHIDALAGALKALGDKPLDTCKFDFSSALGDVATMAAVARVVENVGVSAYAGAATLITDQTVLAAAASILTIEARHQSILNVLGGGTAIPSPFDMALSPSSVLALAGGFISGCDLGIPANPALTVTTKGPVSVGTKLTFTSAGIDKAVGQQLSCQMLTGGAPFGLSFPIDKCVVPAGIDGPVYIYITNSSQPLQSQLKNQCATCITAGPTLAFIDTKREFIGQLARAGPPVKSDQTIAIGNATPAPADGSTPAPATPGNPAPNAPGSPAPNAPGSPAPAVPGSSALPGSSAPASSGTPSGSSSAASPSSSPAAGGTAAIKPAEANSLPSGANASTGLSAFDGAVVVAGWTTIPKPA
jgi:hypothetical protein